MKPSKLISMIDNYAQQSKFGAQKLLLVYTVESTAKDSLTKNRIGLIISLMDDATKELESIRKAEGIFKDDN